ncbi:MAG: DUF2959 domain-containing protein [Phycisphaerales bacterium]|nr:MAG: DUF2959 domain-containing protein [Phycisphaerales bacterium]
MSGSRCGGVVLVLALVLGGLASGLGGCSKAYYSTMEVFGKEKRDILVSRVKTAREDQNEAKQEFQSALDRFSALVNYKSGDLKAAYDKAKSSMESCEDRADAVRSRISSVESVGDDLFTEWKAELKQYSSEALRENSRRQMEATRAKFDTMLAAMKKASSSMDPVLVAFRDQVLSLKHALNADAIAAMQGTAEEVQSDIRALIAEMEKSIAEADAFLKEMAK